MAAPVEKGNVVTLIFYDFETGGENVPDVQPPKFLFMQYVLTRLK